MIRFVGTGRCGTCYTSRLCIACGVRVGHEKYGEDGISSCQPRHVWDGKTYDKTVLVVRHPVACVSSLTTITNGSWRSFSRVTKNELHDDVFRRACEHYVAYNGKLVELCDEIVRVEDLDCVRLDDMFPNLVTCLAETPVANRRRHQTFDLTDTLWGREALAMGERFGYAD